MLVSLLGANIAPQPAHAVPTQDVTLPLDILAAINEYQSLPDFATFARTCRENRDRIRPDLLQLREINRHCGWEVLDAVQRNNRNVFNVNITCALKCDLRNVKHAKVKHGCIKCERCKRATLICLNHKG